MGIDCPDIQRVIHWRPCEEYIQITERAGRDSLSCNAILYYSHKDISYLYMDKSIIDYYTNGTTCHKQFLSPTLTIIHLKNRRIVHVVIYVVTSVNVRILDLLMIFRYY